MQTTLCSQLFYTLSQALESLYAADAFLLSAITYQGEGSADPTAEVHLLFKEHASLRDVLLGQTQAFLVRMLLHQQGFTSAESMIPSHLSGLNFKAREQKLDVLETVHRIVNAQSSDAILDTFDGVSKDVVEELVTKILEDKDWKISNTMLETRFARLC